MPERFVKWQCSMCAQKHISYETAKACEASHVILDASERFRSRLEGVVGKQTYPAAYRSHIA